MSPRCEGVWVLEDVMLVPEHVVWGPSLVWVLQQVGAVPKRKICAPWGIQTRILWSRRTFAAIFLQSACAHRLQSLCVILSLNEAVSCSDCRLQPDS